MKNFTKEEIEELEGKSPHPLPEIPEQLLNYLNDFIGLTTIEALETRVRKRYFDFHEEFYLDWAQNSIQNVLRLFHAKYFPLTTQTEADIIRRVYTFIDTIFDDKHNLDVRTGEMESSASSDRRNLLRQPDERKKHGHKSDMLFISFKGEVGCTEVGKKDAGDNGTKEQNALGLKLPKMLKDQMWKLVHLFPENRSDLVTVGLVMMGLKLRAVILDNPSTYVCRVKKTKPYFFPTTVETIASDLGMLLGVTSQAYSMIMF
ncbi:hypothetical protein BDC45DRAFT_544033 [Circinella umbellata]|nr:hypothetical protein BDC45DRAFT_544033 [Circinella umbellata]